MTVIDTLKLARALRDTGGFSQAAADATASALNEAFAAGRRVERLRQEIKMENRKFFVQAVLAFAAAIGAGIAIGHFWLHG